MPGDGYVVVNELLRGVYMDYIEICKLDDKKETIVIPKSVILNHKYYPIRTRNTNITLHIDYWYATQRCHLFMAVNEGLEVVWTHKKGSKKKGQSLQK